MEIKKNYYFLGIEEYRKIMQKNCDKKPKLLLHVCCGACSCFPLIFLHDLFDVTILFSNSNITPFIEYQKRLEALKEYVKKINEIFKEDIKIIEDSYDYEFFKIDLLPYKDEPEHGKRCKICISKRMERLFSYASTHNYFYVSSVMSISRNKDAEFLNELGLKFMKEYPKITYFLSDFKKNNGQEIGIKLSYKFDVYRQDYCGCEFSKINK